MKIVGCDFHPSHQQVSIFDTVTGEVEELKLMHVEQAMGFYRALEAPVLIGMESVGNSRWFEQAVCGLGHELWIGDAAQIRASYVRRQKTDRRDAGHILRLLLEKRFPRIWTPSNEQRDQRQLLLHRHRLVGMRTRIKTELQHLALNQGVQKKSALWSVLGRAGLLMTQPGVGPVTALAFVVTIGDVGRFPRGKQAASYLGLIPSERSSGSKRRLGAISKQGNVFLRTMLVEAAQSAVRYDETFRKEYLHRCHHKPKGVAKVAAARKLAVRLYWMLRTQQPYAQAVHNEGSPSHSVVG